MNDEEMGKILSLTNAVHELRDRFQEFLSNEVTKVNTEGLESFQEYCVLFLVGFYEPFYTYARRDKGLTRAEWDEIVKKMCDAADSVAQEPIDVK